MKKNVVISTFLLIFVMGLFSDLNGQIIQDVRERGQAEDSLIVESLSEPDPRDTIAVIWVIKSEAGITTRCMTAYDLKYVMEVVGTFFMSVLGEPCVEAIPEKPKSPIKYKKM